MEVRGAGTHTELAQQFRDYMDMIAMLQEYVDPSMQRDLQREMQRAERVMSEVNTLPADHDWLPRFNERWDLWLPWEEGTEIVASYDFHDLSGRVLYTIVRSQVVDPRHAHYGKKGFWAEEEGDVKLVQDLENVVPYRLPQVRAAIAVGEPIYVVEGAKDVHTMEKLGVTATAMPAGGLTFADRIGPFLEGAAYVVIIPDNDVAGALHAKAIRRSTEPHADRVTILPPPPPHRLKGDMTDWVEQGGTAQAFRRYVVQNELPIDA